jgi:predicted nucleic acid-binding protein
VVPVARKLKIYLDTSVPNAYFDERNQYRLDLTREFWSKLPHYHVFVSDLVLKEISATGDPDLRKKLITIVDSFESLETDQEEIRILAQEYVIRGIIPIKYIEDAIHLAVTTINDLDILLSWNFNHMVKLKTKREVNSTNILFGYHSIEIIEPAML